MAHFIKYRKFYTSIPMVIFTSQPQGEGEKGKEKMKKTIKEKMALLLEWAKQTKGNFVEWGEEDFYELRHREKNTILDTIVKTELDYEVGGDCDNVFLIYVVGKASVTFYSYSASCAYPDDIKGLLDEMELMINDNCVTLDEFIEYLEKGKTDVETDVKLVNLTPHTVTFYDVDGVTVICEIPSSGIARVIQNREMLESINNIPVSKTSYGAVEGLPDTEPNTVYIVSVLTAQAARDRDDLYIVDDIVMDDDGSILGYKALAKL